MDSIVCWGWAIRDWVQSLSSWSIIISVMSERGLGCEQSMWSVIGSEIVFVGLTIGRLREGERWPGTDSLKITSLEKKNLPLRSQNSQPSWFLIYLTNIASKRCTAPFPWISSGWCMKHWQPNIHSMDRSGFSFIIFSWGVIWPGSVFVGMQLCRYTAARTAKPQKDGGSFEEMVLMYRLILPLCWCV